MDGEATGVYSNRQIKDAISRGQIVFYPYSEQNINGSSVDLTLGYWYYRTEQPTGKSVYNPLDEFEVYQYFDGPHQAIAHRQWCETYGYRLFAGIPEEHPIIVLGPGQRILAHTHEFVGIRPPGTTSLQARSTWGRNGVAVCLDAGWGDPGYINRWTLEVYNLNQNHSVILPVGERIVQMVFYHTGEVNGEYASLSGKYQAAGADQVRSIIDGWRPEQMLPRAFKDSRNLPQAV